MAVKAYLGATPAILDQLAMDRFVSSLDDRGIRVRLRGGNPKNLDEAVSRAVQLEAIYEAESDQKQEKPSARIQSVMPRDN